MYKLLLLLLLSIPWYCFANLYEEAIKLDAKGEYKEANKKFREYFNNNINQKNQESIIGELFYTSTLMPDSNKSLNFLTDYVKFMKNANSRYRVYIKIAQIYELKGEILLAGKYYEKAAYTVKVSVDYKSLFNSLEMFLELGYFNKTVLKLDKIDQSKLKGIEKDRFYYIYTRAHYLRGDIEQSKKYLNKIDNKDSRYWYLYSEIYRVVERDSRFIRSVEYVILNNQDKKLRTPSDYLGKKSGIYSPAKIAFNRDLEVEFNLGSFRSKNDSAGIVNLLEQIGLSWFMDKNSSSYTLYAFSNEKSKTIKKLNALGINFKIEAKRSEPNIR